MGQISPGQTACLLGGAYEEDLSIRRGGTARHRVVLRSAPGFRATIRGRFWIADSADYVTVEYLNLDGRNSDNLPSPTVNGDRAIFRWDNMTNHRAGAGPETGNGICFNLGFPGYGVAVGTVIERSRIHDCGISDNHNHGIYVVLARNTIIRNNYIYDNGDRGIQLYPDADGTTIEHNVIDGNGEGLIFSGDTDGVSDENTVRWNIISNSAVRWNVEAWYPDGVQAGQNNTVFQNCLWPGNANAFYNHAGGVQSPEVGFNAYENKVAAPQYLDRERKDFRLRPGSRCGADGPQGNVSA